MNPLIKLTLFIFIIFYLNGCESQDKSNHNKMIEILAEKSGVTNPETNIYENKKRLAWLQKQNFDNQDFFRLKECDKDAYKYWNYFIKLYLFIYSHKKNIYKIIELNKLLEILPDCITEKMPDNNQPYKLIPLNKI